MSIGGKNLLPSQQLQMSGKQVGPFPLASARKENGSRASAILCGAMPVWIGPAIGPPNSVETEHFDYREITWEIHGGLLNSKRSQDSVNTVLLR